MALTREEYAQLHANMGMNNALGGGLISQAAAAALTQAATPKWPLPAEKPSRAQIISDLRIIKTRNGYIVVPMPDFQGSVIDWGSSILVKDGESLPDAIAAMLTMQKLDESVGK